MGNPAALKTISNIRWGDLSLICLYISIASGIIVGLQYNVSEPYYSVVAIDLIVPFGAYFRSLHFYSSQFFFLFAVAHYCFVFKASDNYSNIRRLSIVLTLPVALVLLFTGYVLRFDSTGSSAGMIAEHILLTIPLAGDLLNELLFSLTDHGLHRVYLHHVISFDFLFLLLAWDHLRRYRVNILDYPAFTVVVLLFCIFIAAPLDPETLGEFYITGPWFFLGLQELLRYLPPFFAGIIFPGIFLFALLAFKSSSRYFNQLRIFILFWLILYAILTIMSLTLHT